MHKQTLRSVFNLKSKEESKWTKILQIKNSTKSSDKLINKRRIIPSDNDIIHKKKEVDHTRTMMQDKEITVSRRSNKAKMKQLSGEAFKPGHRCLFQSINGLKKKADMRRIGWINISRRLRHKNLFMKHPMKESIRNI